MKRCPNCNQTFSVENIFCLNDGTALLDVSNAGQAPTVLLTPESSPTLFVPRTTGATPNPSTGIPGWLYAVLGAMAALIIALGAAFFVTRAPVEKAIANTEPTTNANELKSSSNQTNTENNPSETMNKSNTNVVSSSPSQMPSINPNLNPSGRWTGDWTSSKANYTAVVVLNDNGGGKFTGEIYWTLQRHTNPKKSYKAGATATEYVRGAFNPMTRTISLSGYRKDDPQDIIVLDKYSLVLAENNLNLGGGSKSNGRFNLSR